MLSFSLLQYNKFLRPLSGIIIINTAFRNIIPYRKFKPHGSVADQRIGTELGARLHQPELPAVGAATWSRPRLRQQHGTTHRHELNAHAM